MTMIRQSKLSADAAPYSVNYRPYLNSSSDPASDQSYPFSLHRSASLGTEFRPYYPLRASWVGNLPAIGEDDGALEPSSEFVEFVQVEQMEGFDGGSSWMVFSSVYQGVAADGYISYNENASGVWPGVYEENSSPCYNSFGASFLAPSAFVMDSSNAFNSNSSYYGYAAQHDPCPINSMVCYPAATCSTSAGCISYADHATALPKEYSTNQNVDCIENYDERSGASSNMKLHSGISVDSFLTKNGLPSSLGHEAATENSKDIFMEAKSGLKIKPIKLPKISSSECGSAERDDSMGNPSKTIDELNLDVDSPCYKGKSASRQSPFVGGETVNFNPMVMEPKGCNDLDNEVVRLDQEESVVSANHSISADGIVNPEIGLRGAVHDGSSNCHPNDAGVTAPSEIVEPPGPSVVSGKPSMGDDAQRINENRGYLQESLFYDYSDANKSKDLVQEVQLVYGNPETLENKEAAQSQIAGSKGDAVVKHSNINTIHCTKRKGKMRSLKSGMKSDKSNINTVDMNQALGKILENICEQEEKLKALLRKNLQNQAEIAWLIKNFEHQFAHMETGIAYCKHQKKGKHKTPLKTKERQQYGRLSTPLADAGDSSHRNTKEALPQDKNKAVEVYESVMTRRRILRGQTDTQTSVSTLKQQMLLGLNDDGVHLQTKETVHSPHSDSEDIADPKSLPTKLAYLGFTEGNPHPSTMDDPEIKISAANNTSEQPSTISRIPTARDYYSSKAILLEVASTSKNYELPLAHEETEIENHKHHTKGRPQEVTRFSSLNSIHNHSEDERPLKTKERFFGESCPRNPHEALPHDTNKGEEVEPSVMARPNSATIEEQLQLLGSKDAGIQLGTKENVHSPHLDSKSNADLKLLPTDLADLEGKEGSRQPCTISDPEIRISAAKNTNEESGQGSNISGSATASDFHSGTGILQPCTVSDPDVEISAAKNTNEKIEQNSNISGSATTRDFHSGSVITDLGHTEGITHPCKTSAAKNTNEEIGHGSNISGSAITDSECIEGIPQPCTMDGCEIEISAAKNTNAEIGQGSNFSESATSRDFHLGNQVADVVFKTGKEVAEAVHDGWLYIVQSLIQNESVF